MERALGIRNWKISWYIKKGSPEPRARGQSTPRKRERNKAHRNRRRDQQHTESSGNSHSWFPPWSSGTSCASLAGLSTGRHPGPPPLIWASLSGCFLLLETRVILPCGSTQALHVCAPGCCSQLWGWPGPRTPSQAVGEPLGHHEPASPWGVASFQTAVPGALSAALRICLSLLVRLPGLLSWPGFQSLF